VLGAILILAVLLGLGAGLAWDRLLGRVDGVGQQAEMTSVPVLATVPQLGEPLGLSAILASGGATFSLLTTPFDEDPTLPEMPAPASAQDSWRSLRTNFMRGTGHLMRSVAVTSLSPGAGKTTVAVNLAASVAEVGLAVVLVDAAMRRPALHELFGLDNGQGLSSTVLNGADPASLLRTVPTIPGLQVVTAGPPMPAPHTEASFYREQLPRFTSLGDLVIVDSPPLQSDAHATLIASVTDAVVLVVSVGADRLELEAALRILKRSGTPVLGTVQTRTSPIVSESGGDLGDRQDSGGLSSTARPQAQ
jgi:polysaccharide biosynthesis transport protein